MFFRSAIRRPVGVVTIFDEPYWEVAKYGLLSMEKSLLGTGVPLVVPHHVDSRGRPAAWRKITAVREMFELGFEVVVWIDADCIVTKPIDWAKLMSPDHDLQLVRHRDPRTGRAVPNLGVVMFRNSRYTRKVLDAIWSSERYVTHKWWENAAFIDLFSPEDFSDEGIRQPREVMSDARIHWLPTRYNSIPIGEGYEDPEPLIVHFAGFPFADRARRMREAYERYVGA